MLSHSQEQKQKELPNLRTKISENRDEQKASSSGAI